MDVGGDEPADGVEDRGLPVSGRLTAATLEASFCETLLVQPDKHSYSAQILIALDGLHRGSRCRSRCRRRRALAPRLCPTPCIRDVTFNVIAITHDVTQSRVCSWPIMKITIKTLQQKVFQVGDQHTAMSLYDSLPDRR